LLAGRLTAHLKGGWLGARLGQIEEKFLIASTVQNADGTDKTIKNDAD
jgi:hypothetical protein